MSLTSVTSGCQPKTRLAFSLEAINVLGSPARRGDVYNRQGQSLSAVLDNLCNWGESHVAHLQEQGQEIYLKCED